ncbi:hypothetical protein GCM10023093_22750 [Nemorincola caseinilytica]|uniref:DUF4870 domain-containing protein n=1 Tax=Nemorincola caseinilytica TaxID=2054315 RepID=A0ABP8NHS4_9BACT
MSRIPGYTPSEMELEKASNGYLMSLIAVMVGMPLPIINLLASLLFYFGNRNSTWFVRWHCTQTLLSQLTVLVINSIGFSWTISLIFGSTVLTNDYIAYMMTMVAFNIVEFIATISAAVRTRRGEHVELWFWGSLTNVVCPPPRWRNDERPLTPQNPY